MSEKVSATIEDYLSIIYVLDRDGETITGARLAELLKVSAPTVTNTLKRMVRDGLATLDSAHVPHLTDAGTEAARSVMRRHMLAEWMLARVIPWSKLHKEAHQLEHAISDEVETAFFADLNQPKVCPHGNPFPGYEQRVSAWIPLTSAPVGKPLVLRRIHELVENSSEALAFLEQKKIAPGQEVIVKEILDFNQTLTLCVAETTVSLGFALAQYLFVE